MKSIKFVLAGLLALLAALSLSACGGTAQAITLDQVPQFPNAVQLQPGEDVMADSLAQNMATAGQMGQKLEQRIFTLPADAEWGAIDGFYSEKLKADGWQTLNSPVAIPGNDMMQMTIWTRGTQSLTVAQLTEPVSSKKYLLYSLASQ